MATSTPDRTLKRLVRDTIVENVQHHPDWAIGQITTTLHYWERLPNDPDRDRLIVALVGTHGMSWEFDDARCRLAEPQYQGLLDTGHDAYKVDVSSLLEDEIAADAEAYANSDTKQTVFDTNYPAHPETLGRVR